MIMELLYYTSSAWHRVSSYWFFSSKRNFKPKNEKKKREALKTLFPARLARSNFNLGYFTG